MVLVLLLLVIAPTLSLAQPKAEEYRLPTWYNPTSYKLNLNIPSDVFTPTGTTFSGTVAITFSVTAVTSSISLHSKNDFITINTVTVTDNEIAPVNVAVTSYTTNNVTDIITINLAGNLTIGVAYVLNIGYSSRVSTTDMYGLYKSSYVDTNGVTKYLVISQLQSIHARRAFPCFDEPGFKATFEVTVSIPSGLNVLSNTQLSVSSIDQISGVTTVTFKTTPKMSTYLLSLIISEFSCTTGAPIGSVPYQVCSRNGSEATREVAVEYGPKLLARLNNFTAYDYSRAMEKLDQIAIPDFAAGAMENWGLVTYRETALLWDRNESSNQYQQRVVTVIAHELSHQWFGNLVTMKWWSETFLNEGFATYFEYHIAHEVLASWELNKQFVLQELHTALAGDALESAQALQMACSTPAEINSRFGVISYNKGGSVLRMVEHFMKLENFKVGLQNYLLAYEYSNTVPDDLWTVLNRSIVPSVSKLPADLLTVMYNWVTRPGFPLLTVNLRGSSVTISQRRFLLSGIDTITEWYVPITYATSANTTKFQTTTPDTWLVPNQDVTITLPPNAHWIILNNQQTGYYRVNYDDALWARIRAALLQTNFGGIPELNRAQIVDDLFNLARAGHVKYSTIFHRMRFLYNDASYYSWYPALVGYNFLLRRVGQDSTLGQMISNRILDLMTTLYRSVPLETLKEDDQIYTLKQVMAHSWACRLGGTNCIGEVRKWFNEYKTLGVRPHRNFRAMVYCYALRYSNDSSDWTFLWNAYVNSTDLATEQLTIISALGCTNDTSLLTGYLNKSIIDGSGIRPQDALSVFVSVYSGTPVGADVAFEFLMENYVAIAEKYQSMNSLKSLIEGIAERFTKKSQIDRLRNFTENGNLPEAFRVSATEALEAAEANLNWLAKYENELTAYYSAGAKIGSSLLAMVMALVCVLAAN